ncbi:choice-of-anchor H family protein [Colwelliaceae bacterium 6441]
MITKLISVTLFTLCTVNAVANDELLKVTSQSVGSLKTQWQQPEALNKLKAPVGSLSLNKINDKTGKTRQQVLMLKQKKQKRALALRNKNSAAPNAKLSTILHGSFNIYSGYSQLIEDFDQDGYFQTFSVTFDADVYDYHDVNHARVYAELYLSKNGGDWIHYYTTDNFNIYGESEDDEYEVYTTLNQGYSPDEYDVLIDLYEVGYNDIVATYSADDTNELYALPLESSDYDPDYVEHHSDSHGHGGSHSLFSILFIFSLLVTRSVLSRNTLKP